MFDFDDLEEDDPAPDWELLAQEQAQAAVEDLADPAWDVRRNACRLLGTLGAAAEPFLAALKRSRV